MKRIATFAAMLVLAACGAKTEEVKIDSAAPAAAPAMEMAAPAVMDSAAKDTTAAAKAAPAADTAKKM